MTTPDYEPATIVAGDTSKWTKSLSDYKAGDGWSLTYELVGVASLTKAATTDGDTFEIEVTAAETAPLNPSTTSRDAELYNFVGYVTKAAERYTVFHGSLYVYPDPTALAAAELTSHARKVLTAIEAVLEGRASKDQEAYSINGRSLNRTPLADLIMMRDKYKSEVAAEEKRELRKRGLATGSRVLARFV